MPPIKFSHLVSFSSEDAPAYAADNLLSTEGTRKWRCSTAGEKQLSAVIQLERASLISNVDIGNDGSALVEVQVGRKDMADSDYKTLLVASSFMSPLESRNEKCLNRVRMFGPEKLNAEVATQKWDRIRVICTQPFNQHLKYGLSFLNLASPLVKEKENGKGGNVNNAATTTRLGAFSVKAEEDEEEEQLSAVGGLFAARNKTVDSGSSTAVELRSERTLASLALAQSGGQDRPMFYQLKKEKADEEALKKKDKHGKDSRKKKEELESQKQNKHRDDMKKLPRRDVQPGESPPKIRRTESGSSSKTGGNPSKAGSSQESSHSTREKKTKPFKQLLEGVVFTISGIQNPQRGVLREAALAMGAKYRPDWDATCTHLVCAFANTPKFATVKKKKGKIVKKEWIERCSADRRRYPWRRYCLDPADKEEEVSEDEVWEEMSKRAITPKKEVNDDMDTDDEIEAVKKEKDEYNADTDEGSDAAYNVETDVDDDDDDCIGNGAKRSRTDFPELSEKVRSVEKKKSAASKNKCDHLSFPTLPNFFGSVDHKEQNQIFYLFGDFSDIEQKKLERWIVAAGGSVSQYMGKEVTAVVTNSDWCDDFEAAMKRNKGLRFLRPEFVAACYDQGRCVDFDKFKVERLY